MDRFFHRWARMVSSPRGAKIVIACWLIVILALSALAPGSKPYAVSSGEGSVRDNTPSAAAQAIMDEYFPSNDGLVALLVFHSQEKMPTEDRDKIKQISEWLASEDKPRHVASALPFHRFPEAVQDKMFSEDQSTLLLNVALEKDLESSQIYDTLKEIRSHVEQIKGTGLQFEITGPAGIASDTITLFKNADFVLMLATIGLILVILILIYRSPLLALLPLLIAVMVYQVVDRVLGIAAMNGWFVIDKQALSIMMILLFAVLTDYCLFVISRYREELKKIGSKYDAMKVAMAQVAEPILFSGATVFIAMLTLFTAVFKPYHHFAPVFSVAVFVMLIGGLTLIPALFALIGRKVFWPFVPKLQDEAVKPKGFWTGMGAFVTKKPAATAIVLLLLLGASSFNIGNMSYSFNLMKSFPEDISSRQGFEILEDRFPPGKLAPISVVLHSDKEIELTESFVNKLAALTESLQSEDGIYEIKPEITSDLAKPDASLPRNFMAESRTAVKLQVTLKDNPYDPAALDLIEGLRGKSAALLKDSGLDPSRYSLYYAGQTAEQADVRTMNQRDILVAFSLITLFIAIMLALQTRSILLAVYMMATILLSYTATMGLGWIIFHNVLGYEAVSYRLPVYTFVFLIALGVDYNIMLVSRIKEEARKYEWREAVRRGVSRTGSVISSAGIILAATFCVLITQPLQELFLFGMTMTLGILTDTFLVRGMLLPSILSLSGGKGKNVQETKVNTTIGE
ncbi:MMPL family transporter [Paenibacillus sp. MSJ-34]|uniref:MMPL family transporter n=1 Tax=Paenibacillus sp. MSJ-34 TaxID=2841529 RepID=UPI001C0F4237|nr:MMPL family transporter [Paenibacillus sp. MSJ-34]MBU5444566.1 MMPL family transporter [Paenibacillus sp. MSJ-34]